MLPRFSICSSRFDLIWAYHSIPYSSVPTTNVDRTERKSRLVGLRRYPARGSKSRTLDRFRAVGAIEFEFWVSYSAMHVLVHNFFFLSFFVITTYYITDLFIHHIIFPPSPLLVDNNFPSATHLSSCILSVFTSHKEFSAINRL